MYGYIYLITNLVNNKKYVGQRTGNYSTDTSYLGSGTLIKRAISKYGKENFSKELLEECATKEDLDAKEIYWISKFDAVNSSEFYNLATGANGSVKGSKKSEMCKQRIAESKRGKTLSEDAKHKISKTVSLQVWVTNGSVETKATKETLQKFLDDGYVLGRLPFSEDAKKHMSEAFTGRTHSESTKEKLRVLNSGDKNGFYGKRHSEVSKQKMSESAKGRKASNETKQLLSKQKIGRRWITNGKQNKFVKPEELEFYLSDGWYFGISS